MTPNERLIEEWIRQIAGSTLNDVRSSIAARVLLRGRSDFGGGNFLMAQGLFATLNLLAKVYVLLMDEETAGQCSEINETAAFHTLVTALPEEFQKLGLNESEIDRAWHSFRNTPAHMGRPREMTLAYDIAIEPDSTIDGLGADKAVEAVNGKIAEKFASDTPAFSKPDDFIHCNVDLLARDLERITTWLCDLIVKADEPHAKKCLDWIETKFIVEIDKV